MSNCSSLQFNPNAFTTAGSFVLFVIWVVTVPLLVSCKQKMEEGEVFLLLNSDEVKPLADIEVMSFGRDFGDQFSAWQRKWNHELQNVVSTEAGLPWRSRLENIDERIQVAARLRTDMNESSGNTLRQISRKLEDEAITLTDQTIVLTNRIADTREVLGMLDPKRAATEQDANKFKYASTLLRKLEEELQNMQTRLAALRNGGAMQIEIDQLKQSLILEEEKLRQERAAFLSFAQTELRQKCIADFPAFLTNKATYSTRTGSRGNFQLPSTAHYVFAGTVRPTGEFPCWLVRINPTQTPIRLSNSNLTAKDDSDETWMLKCRP